MTKTVQPTHEQIKKHLLRIYGAKSKAVDWARAYALQGVAMIDEGCSDEDLKVQLLYVLNNISYWRGTDANVSRDCLRLFIAHVNDR